MSTPAATSVRPGLHASPGELLHDVLGWDPTWAPALTFWQRWTTVDLTSSTALEIGAGQSGGLSLWLALQGCEVICSTPGGVPSAVREHHRRYGVSHRIRYESLDALELAEREAFDVVAFKSVLASVGDGRRAMKREAVDRLHRALKISGNLLFAEPIAATRAHALFRATSRAGCLERHRPSIEEMLGLLQPFGPVQYRTAGFFGAYGRNRVQQRVSAALDGFLCRWVVPAAWQHVMVGIAVKEGPRDGHEHDDRFQFRPPGY
jgi:hypothetical protein